MSAIFVEACLAMIAKFHVQGVLPTPCIPKVLHRLHVIVKNICLAAMGFARE